MLTEEKKIALARVIERVDRVGGETCNEDVDFLIDNLRETYGENIKNKTSVSNERRETECNNN